MTYQFFSFFSFFIWEGVGCLLFLGFHRIWPNELSLIRFEVHVPVSAVVSPKML